MGPTSGDGYRQNRNKEDTEGRKDEPVSTGNHQKLPKARKASLPGPSGGAWAADASTSDSGFQNHEGIPSSPFKSPNL